MEVLEHHDDRCVGRHALEERPPGAEERLRGNARLHAQQGEQRRLDPPPLGLVRHVLGKRRRDPLARGRLVVGLEQPGPAPDHLAEGPERDAVAVGRRAAVVVPHRLDDAVEVLEELPAEPRLADARGADHRHEAGPPLAAGRVEQVLEQAELDVAADERGLERVGAAAPPALGHHAQCAPRGDRRALAAQRLLARGLKGDRSVGGSLRRLAHEHGSGGGGCLESAGRVHEIAGDHPLVGGADRDDGLARQDTGASLDAWSEAVDRVDEVERRPNSALGVVLVCRRRSPDGHHGVPDELLDAAAVPGDHIAGQIEVARQELARLLGVLALRDGREAHEVGEQHRHQPPLRHRAGRGGSIPRSRHARRRGGCQSCAAGAAKLLARLDWRRARRADGGERASALGAEPPTRLVLRGAIRADHAALRCNLRRRAYSSRSPWVTTRAGEPDPDVAWAHGSVESLDAVV